MKREWLDLSVPLRSSVVRWAGDPEVRIERARSIGPDEVCNVSALAFGAHTGTHIDAPLHFIDGAVGVDQAPLDALIGPARVIAISERTCVTPAALARHRLRRGERILLKTPNSMRCWQRAEFVEDFTYVSKAAAQYLVRRGVRTVGIDYLSVGGFRQDGVETHQALLGAGIWVIEGLNLARVVPGRYDLVCLPLRILDCDGAPARAVLRKPRR